MKPKYLLALLGLMLLLLASGCFQVQQEMWVNPDGSGKMMLDIGVDESFLAMMNQNGGSNPFAEWKNMEQAASKDTNISKIVTSEKSENNIHHYIADLDVKNFLGYTEATPAGSGFKVEKLGNGNMKFSQTIEFGNSQQLTSAQSGMSDMLATALKDDYYIVRLHVPVIVSADPEAVVDGKTNTVEWKIPMKDLLMDQKKVNVWVEFKTANAGLPVGTWGAIGGILVLLLGGGLFYFFRLPRTMPAPIFDSPEVPAGDANPEPAPAASND